MSSSIRLTVGGIDISDLVVGELSVQHAINESSTMKAALRPDGRALRYLDLRGNIVLDLHDGEKLVRQFTGVVTEGDADAENYTLKCVSPMQLMDEARTGGAFGRGLYPGEIVYYLAAMVTPESVHPSRIFADRERRMSDLPWLFTPRRYQFIAPVPALRLTQDDIEIADVTLYIADSGGYVDDKNIASGLPAETPPEWKDGATRVRFTVEASGFLDAFDKGQERLQKLLDFLSFAANFSTPSYCWRGQDQYHDYRRAGALTDITETPWAYVRDIVPFRPQRYWLRWCAPHRYDNPLPVTLGDPLLTLYEPFRPLLEEDDRRLTLRRRSLLSAVHALRRSRQAPNPQDALHHVWQGIEFLVSNYEVPSLFTKYDRKALLKAAKNVVRERYSDHEERRQREARLEQLAQNQPSLRQKWDAFCADHSLLYHVDDTDFLWGPMRKARNLDVHGEVATVKRKDVERTAAIVEKAVMNVLEDETKPAD